MKEHLLRKKFELPEGHPIKSFVMREIDGEDELDAGRMVAAKGTSADLAGQAISTENIRIGVVEVDDKPVQSPWMGLDKLPTKTRRFFLEAWILMNGVEDDDVKKFLAGAKTVA